MNIDDKVMSKKTGFPASGTVVAILKPEVWMKLENRDTSKYTVWNNLYPDWHTKLLIIVKFNEPQKNMTFEELLASFPDADVDRLKEYYDYELPLTEAAVYPIDDLEPWE